MDCHDMLWHSMIHSFFHIVTAHMTHWHAVQNQKMLVVMQMMTDQNMQLAGTKICLGVLDIALYDQCYLTKRGKSGLTWFIL